MENVILIVHLLLALALIGLVLMQRSEGGGLGMGGGGGGAMSARAAGTAMGRLTWILAGLFIATSLTLTILAASDSASGSIMDRFAPSASSDEGETGDGGLDLDGLLPPPSAGAADVEGDAPLVPRAE